MRVLNLEPTDIVLEKEGDSAIICVCRVSFTFVPPAGIKVGPYPNVHRHEPGLPSAITRT